MAGTKRQAFTTSTPNSAIIARGLTDEVVGKIAKFKEIVVIASGPAGSAVGATPDSTFARYALQGSVRIEGEKLRLTARLVNRADESIIWADSYDETLKVQDLLEAQRDIALKVAATVAQPSGAIFRADAAQVVKSPPDDWEAYACTLAYYNYRADLKAKMHKPVQDCLKRATKRFPNYASAWALLSLTYLDEVRFRFAIDAKPSPPLDLALDAARRAVDLDPENMRGLQAYMTALFFHGDVDAALKVGARAAAINPNDTEFVAEYGLRLALSGEWRRGKDLMLQVLDRSPGPLGYYESVIALCYYMQAEYQAAATWIGKANLQANPIYHLIAAAIFGQVGQMKEAGLERDWLVRNAPEFLTELPETIKMRNVPPQDLAHFADGLRKAGLTVAGL
jgi:TolB-like protein